MGNLWSLRVARRVPGGGFFIHAPATRRPVGWRAERAGGGGGAVTARPRWQWRAALLPSTQPMGARLLPRLEPLERAAPGVAHRKARVEVQRV